METRIAAWCLSGVQQDAWRLHSSLILPSNHAVTALDSKSGKLFRCFPVNPVLYPPGLIAVGSENSLSVYTLILENDLPTWSQKWMVKCVIPYLPRILSQCEMSSIETPSLTRFAPSLMYIAATA